MHLKNCQLCGDAFEARDRRHRFCASGCHNENERIQARKARSTFSPARRRAAILTASAIQCGDLKRQPCEVCGAVPVDAHHDDYSQPLAVRWLCRKHHKQHHNANGRARAA